jgi:hypothetical protein
VSCPLAGTQPDIFIEIYIIISYLSMKRTSTSQNKSKSRSLARSASTGLIDFLKKKYDQSIPVSVVTAAHKVYGKSKPLSREDRFIKRFEDQKGTLNAEKFLSYLGKTDAQERGKGLTEEAMRRIYSNCSNQDGKLTF